MADNRAIGIFDSGLGGLTVTREIIKLLPCENVVYFGDTGRVPYGTKGRDTIRKYALQDERFLLSHNVKLIVAACGTVSSVEVVSHSVKAAVAATKNKKIGVLATSTTISSGAHKNQILKLLPDAKVTESSGTLLVSLVEEGWTGSNDSVVLETLRRYLKPMIDARVDTIILGCTHFPVLLDAISKVLGTGVTLINMGVSTASAVFETLKKSNSLNDGKTVPSHKFYVSDKTSAFAKTASILLGEYEKNFVIEGADIEKL